MRWLYEEPVVSSAMIMDLLTRIEERQHTCPLMFSGYNSLCHLAASVDGHTFTCVLFPREPQKKSICFIHLRSIGNVIIFVVARYSTKGLQNVSFFFTQKEQIASLGLESCRCGFRFVCEHIKEEKVQESKCVV